MLVVQVTSDQLPQSTRPASKTSLSRSLRSMNSYRATISASAYHGNKWSFMQMKRTLLPRDYSGPIRWPRSSNWPHSTGQSAGSTASWSMAMTSYQSRQSRNLPATHAVLLYKPRLAHDPAKNGFLTRVVGRHLQMSGPRPESSVSSTAFRQQCIRGHSRRVTLPRLPCPLKSRHAGQALSQRLAWNTPSRPMHENTMERA